MNTVQIQLRDGSTAFLHQAETGFWICPVCGSPELLNQPYYPEGAASFQMCSCGFEFGFDDDPGASASALPGVQENWSSWRSKLVSQMTANQLVQLKSNLATIGVYIQ